MAKGPSRSWPTPVSDPMVFARTLQVKARSRAHDMGAVDAPEARARCPRRVAPSRAPGPSPAPALRWPREAIRHDRRPTYGSTPPPSSRGPRRRPPSGFSRRATRLRGPRPEAPPRPSPRQGCQRRYHRYFFGEGVGAFPNARMIRSLSENGSLNSPLIRSDPVPPLAAFNLGRYLDSTFSGFAWRSAHRNSFS